MHEVVFEPAFDPSELQKMQETGKYNFPTFIPKNLRNLMGLGHHAHLIQYKPKITIKNGHKTTEFEIDKEKTRKKLPRKSKERETNFMSQTSGKS